MYLYGNMVAYFAGNLGNWQFVYPFAIFFGSGRGVRAPMFMSVAATSFKGGASGLSMAS
jgi:hypothetical protein